VGGLCLTTWARTPCINPWASPQLELQQSKKAILAPVLTSSAQAWSNSRTYWCLFSAALHYALLGCAALLLLEFVLKFIAHQGPQRFFMNLNPPAKTNAKKKEEKQESKQSADKPKGIYNRLLSLFQKFLSIILWPLIVLISNFAKQIHVTNVVDSVCILTTVIGTFLTELNFETQVLVGCPNFFIKSMNRSKLKT
jgi:hypothetical protein